MQTISWSQNRQVATAAGTFLGVKIGRRHPQLEHFFESKSAEGIRKCGTSLKAINNAEMRELA